MWDRMQHESLQRPVTTVPSVIKPVHRFGRHGSSSRPRLVSVLVSVHPRPSPFTNVHADRFWQFADGGGRR